MEIGAAAGSTMTLIRPPGSADVINKAMQTSALERLARYQREGTGIGTEIQNSGSVTDTGETVRSAYTFRGSFSILLAWTAVHDSFRALKDSTFLAIDIDICMEQVFCREAFKYWLFDFRRSHSRPKGREGGDSSKPRSDAPALKAPREGRLDEKPRSLASTRLAGIPEDLRQAALAAAQKRRREAEATAQQEKEAAEAAVERLKEVEETLVSSSCPNTLEGRAYLSLASIEINFNTTM